MTNRNYNSGRAFEYRTKKYLEKKGYYVVRSAGSHSPVDLVAVNKNHECLLLQCKHGKRSYVSEEELEGLYRLQWYFFNSFAYIVASDKGKIMFYKLYRDSRGIDYNKHGSAI